MRVVIEKEKVVTHRANAKFAIEEWQDESAPIASLFYLQAMMLTRLRVHQDIEFSDEAEERYNREMEAWRQDNSRDVHNDFSQSKTIPHGDPYTLVYNTADGKLPWYANSRLLCQMDAWFCGWIQRYQLAEETYEVDYDLEKLVLK